MYGEFSVTNTRFSNARLSAPRGGARLFSAQSTAYKSAIAARLMAALVVLTMILAQAQAQARPAPDSFADLADRLLPAVVNISTSQVIEGHSVPQFPQLPPGSPFEEFFKEFSDRSRPGQPSRRKATSLGSGFIIDVRGYVVTNNHVIRNADKITVILQDDTRLEAELVGTDVKTDLAVLKIEPKNKLTAVKFGNSDEARVGDWVLAIGNPFGLGGSVTAGIVSARGRNINSGPYDDYLQTDAPINRGNSGGPMFDTNGQVIGINTAIYSPSGVGSVGIGFAIPSSTAQAVVEQLIKYGQVKRGWLGVHIQGVTDEIAESLGMKEARGALVASVMENGPAAAGGLRPGDVILSFNGEDVDEMRELPRIVAQAQIGRKVAVKIRRDGKLKTLRIKVGKLDESRTETASRGSDDVKLDDLGLGISSLTGDVRGRYNLAEDSRGVVVTTVDRKGPAAEKGIRPGDVIIEAGQRAVSTPADVVAGVKAAKKNGRKSVLLLVEGQRGLRFVAVRID